MTQNYCIIVKTELLHCVSFTYVCVCVMVLKRSGEWWMLHLQWQRLYFWMQDSFWSHDQEVKTCPAVKIQFPPQKNETFAPKMKLLHKKCDIPYGFYAWVNTLTQTQTSVEDTHLKITVYHCQNCPITMACVIDSHVTVICPKYNNSFFKGISLVQLQPEFASASQWMILNPYFWYVFPVQKVW